MSSKKFFYIMCGLFALSIIGGIAVLYSADKILVKRSENVVALKLESRTLEEQQSAYQQAKTNVEKYQYLKTIIASALPQDKDQARTVREIFVLAEQSGIKVKSVQFPSSTLGGTATTQTSPTAATTTPLTQAKAVEGLKGVYAIETIVTPYADGKTYKVSYDQLIEFLKKLESNRRAMQVSNIQLTPLGQSSTDSISFTITLNIFIKP